MRKVLLLVLITGCWMATYSTDARVVAMGRHDIFFMDEVSIFRNPANINIYPNMVYGSYGVYRQMPGDTGQFAAMEKNNRDPIDPFFGAIVSYSLNQNSENRNQYPMLSMGAIFNRHDEMLDYITKGTKNYSGSPTDSLVPPVGKVDLIFGYVLKNGGMIGAGGYMAFQSETGANAKDIVDYETSLYKGNLGINWPVAKSVNLEVSVNGGIIRAKGDSAFNINPDARDKIILAENDWFFRSDLRLFSALTLLNGDFVPHIGIQTVNLYKGAVTLNDVAGGLGLNINIDKGFFWAGVEGLYKEGTYFNDSTTSAIGGRVSFGVERSIWWDWFVLRVGGQKEILYRTTDNGSKQVGRWDENAPSDASDNDLVGLGFGVNIDNRARFDFVAAEDIAYTFTNIVSAPMHHIFTRVSATYSF